MITKLICIFPNQITKMMILLKIGVKLLNLWISIQLHLVLYFIVKIISVNTPKMRQFNLTEKYMYI